MKITSSIFLCFVVILSGCNAGLTKTNTVVAHDSVPVLNKPDRPQLETLTVDEVKAFKTLPAELQTKLLFNDKSIKVWAEQLSVTIEDYNKYATQHNILASQWVNGLDQPKGK